MFCSEFESYCRDEELRPLTVEERAQTQRRRCQQEILKFAHLTMKNNTFAHFARAFLIFGHFKDVLVLSMT